MKRILSIDGGGIRGIVPCCALIALEAQTGKLTRDLFDFFAGTSTGALLAAAIQVGIPAKDILGIYTQRSKDIFTPGPPRSTARYLARGYKFQSQNIADVLRSEFGSARAWTLNECPKRILLTAVAVNRHVWYFTQDNPKNGRITGGLSLIDCAAASAAAPTYFTPWYVAPLTGTLVGKCFDGGAACVANPAWQACIEAFHYDSLVPDQTQIISLGTGFYPDTEVNEPRSLVGMIGWSVDTLLDTAGDNQTKYVDLIYPGRQQRFNWQLPSAIDMADVSAIPDLVTLGQRAAGGMDWLKVLSIA